MNEQTVANLARQQSRVYTYCILHTREETQTSKQWGCKPPRNKSERLLLLGSQAHQCSRNSEDRVEALQYCGDEQELADACIHGEVGQVVP